MFKYCLILIVVSSVTFECNGHLGILDIVGNVHDHVHSTVDKVAGGILGGLNVNFQGHVGVGAQKYPSRPQQPQPQPGGQQTIVVVVKEESNEQDNGYNNGMRPNYNGQPPYNNNYNNQNRPGYNNNNQGQWDGNYNINNQNPNGNHYGNQNGNGNPHNGNYGPNRYPNQEQNYHQQRPNQNNGQGNNYGNNGGNNYGNGENNYGSGENNYGNGENNYGNGGNNYGNGGNNQRPNQNNQGNYQPDQTTQGQYGGNNYGQQTTPKQETKPTFGSVHEAPTETPVTEKTTEKDEPLFVPLNPNQYHYGGDKITVNAPKRETDIDKNSEDKDEDLPIDIRFQDQ